MKRLPTEDRAVAVLVAPSKFCPRRLSNDGKGPSVKRYMSVGPLIGYMIACPACGFVEMHMHAKHGFLERDGALVGIESPATCIHCRRSVRVREEAGLALLEALR